MRVLTIGSDATIFDADSAAHARMRAYADAIGELHILSFANPGAKEERYGNLFLYPVFASKIFRVRALTSRAHKLILEKGIEIVSAQDPFEHGLAAQKAIRGTRAKLHIQVHTDFLSPWFIKGNMRMAFLNRFRRSIADYVLPSADGIRAVSQRIKNSLIKHYGSRIPEPSVIPIAINTTPPGAERLPKHDFAFALIAVSRLEPEKHIEDILEAMKIVTKKYPKTGLFIAGDGHERRKLENLTRTLGLGKKVVFLGNRPDAWGLMRSSQAFVQASAYEGYGRTLVEAALARVPIITTDIGIVGEVLRDNKEVLSSPIANPSALALNIVRCIENDALRQEIVKNAELAAIAHTKSAGDSPTRIVDDFTRVKNTDKTGVVKNGIPRVIRYLISGGSGAVVNIGTLFVLTHFFAVWYLISSIIAFLFGFLVSFYLQRTWTFDHRTTNGLARHTILYFIVALGNTLLNAAFVFSLVEHLQVWYVVAQIISGAFISITSFFVYKKIFV